MAQFGSSAAGTMYFDTGGVFFQDETVFLNQRKRPETKLRASCLQQAGMAEMQFIFDFIWMQSCENYLEAMGKQETQQ